VFILPESLRHLGLIRDYLYILIQTCTAEWHTKQQVSHSLSPSAYRLP